MADQRSVLKEYRHLDEKLRTVGLSPSEEARWRELRDLVSPPEPEAPAAPGFDVTAAAEALKASLEPAGRRRPAAVPPAALSPIEEEVSSPEGAEGAAPLDASTFGPAADQGYGAEPSPEGQAYAEAQPEYSEAAQLDEAAAQAQAPGAEPYPEGQAYAEAQPEYSEAAQLDEAVAQAQAPGAEPYPEGQAYAEAEPSLETAQAPPAEPSDAELQAWDPNAFPGAIDAAAFADGSPGLESAGLGEVFPEYPGGAPLDASALPPVEAELQPAEVEAGVPAEQPQLAPETFEAIASAPEEVPSGEPFQRAAPEEPAPAETAVVPGDHPEPAGTETPTPTETVTETPAEGLETWESLTPANVADAPPVPLASAADFLAEAAAAQGPGPAAPVEAEAAPEPPPEGEPVDLEDLVIEEISTIEVADLVEEAPEVASPPAAPVSAPSAAAPAGPPRPPAAKTAASVVPPPAPAPAAPPVLAPHGFGGPSPSFFPGTHRVVVHTVEGQVRRGALTDVELDAPAIPLETQSGGGVESIPASRIKAVFFMLAPGEPSPVPEGKKVRVIFRDGRQVAGYSPDYDPQLAGFFMLPADTRTNTARIWVYREAVREVAVT